VVTHTYARTGERTIAIEAIRVSGRKLRKLSHAKIRRYRLAYEAGDAFPPITVDDCGGFYTIRDGRHRYQAQLACGFAAVSVLVMN
jgi:hypothetical protein